MREFDLEAFRSDRRYYEHTLPLIERDLENEAVYEQHFDYYDETNWLDALPEEVVTNLREFPEEQEMIMTLKLYSMPAAAAKLGYSLSFMNRICQRAICSGRPFLVLKDENAKYFWNAVSRYFTIRSPGFSFWFLSWKMNAVSSPPSAHA